MDGIANVARQQQSQVSSVETHGRVAEQAKQVAQTQEQSTVEVAKVMAQEAENHGTKINSKEDVQDLVNKLNEALAPMSTGIRFGVDAQDIFFVSVIESETSKILRRFPAEQAQDFLPKMQEVTGILFDTKG
ncbi:MAG: flagellar protein FlaG [Sulfurimonas sp.]